ncbi:hypothetical protein FGG08_001009 [Glutinoglossum americanum]|uniref:Transmembrane protein n=1 Tax=Glutinoglossum americanum TaxID=1670608 RepID=A0A9P8I7Z4_9PEZI|nr:hypothetical protein FGG08_001009 [Glutinoglossum americanum]
MSTRLMSRRKTSREKSKQPIHACPKLQQASGQPGGQQRDSIDKGIPSLAGLMGLKVHLSAKRKAVSIDAGLASQGSPSGTPETAGCLNPSPDQPNGIEVVQKLSKKEQLKRFSFTSALNWTADGDATFDEAHQSKLKEFLGHWEKNNAIWFHGLPSRGIVADLVMMTGTNASTLPYICIRGLKSDVEITSYHKALSRKSIRERYQPLKICYDKCRIGKASSEEIYQGHIEYGQWTLCGTLAQAGHTGSGSWVSTIGGMLTVDGKMYAITTAHSPDGSDSVSRDAAADEGSVQSSAADSIDTSVEEGIVDLVEPALIVDRWKGGQEDMTSEPQPLRFQRHIEPLDPSFWPNIGKTFMQGSDWRLLDIGDEALWLPNAVVDLASHARAGQEGEALWVDFRGTASRTYLTTYDQELRRKPVHIIAGKSGVCPGMLSHNVSYLRLGAGPFILVWKVQLKTGFSMTHNSRLIRYMLTLLALQGGDSGSWVVDVANNSVVGHVVAFTEGSAYLIPLHELFRDIGTVINPKGSIRLPGPFRMLANLARHFHSYPDESSKEFARMYAIEALTDTVLDLDIPDKEGELMKRVIKNSQDIESFAQLLCLTGANVRDALVSPSAWVSDHAGENKGEIQRLLLRLKEVDNVTQSASSDLQPIPQELPRELPGLTPYTLEPRLPIPTQLRLPSPPSPTPPRELGPRRRHPFAVGFYVTIISTFIILGTGAAAGVAAVVVGSRVNGNSTSAKILWVASTGGLMLSGVSGLLAILYGALGLLEKRRMLLPFYLAVFFCAFGSTVFPTLALSSEALGHIPKALLVAAAAAGAPMCYDVMAPLLSYPVPFHADTLAVAGLLVGIGVVVGVSSDALAGYAFARVAQNWGMSPLQSSIISTGPYFSSKRYTSHPNQLKIG